MNDLHEFICLKPWTHIELRKNLDLGLCCEDWLPEPIGSMQSAESISTQFNSERARKIRRSILDGSFAYCNKTACPHLQMGNLPRRRDILKKTILPWNRASAADKEARDILQHGRDTARQPRFYQLCYDETCNITCPSCRSNTISMNQGETYERNLAVQERFYRETLTEPLQQWAIISICGSGDPFASRLYRQLQERIDGTSQPHLRINFQTNGLLFTPRLWEQLKNIHRNVLDIIVSVDAAQASTYEAVRRGGNWDTLMQNLKFIATLRQRRAFRGLFRLDFVVQQRNYREMVDFIRIAEGLRVDTIQFHALMPYMEHSEVTIGREYHEHAVWLQEHPEYEQLLQVLDNPAFDSPLVNLGVLTPLRRTNRTWSST